MSRYENRVQLALALVMGLLLVANLFALALVAFAPTTRETRAPVLFTVFVITLLVSVPSLLLIPRRLLKPYRKLVDEAERAPVAAARGGAEAGDETEFVLKTFQEVVAQLGAKQKELERLGAQARARAASAELFGERIVASVPSGLVAIDSAGRATVINAPAGQLLGIGGRAEGRSYEELLTNAPELAELIESCLRTGDVYRREEVEARVGGAARRLGVTVAPIELEAAGGARGALCLLTDITEVARLREAVALKKNLESLGEMAAGLSHEFKNSLATLHGYAQLIQQLDLDERGQAAASALLEEVRSLAEMVTAFLNFARPKPLELADVSLTELAEQCAADVEKFYAERRTELRVEGEATELRADARMLRQALVNLLRNAAEAIPEDADERRVTLRLSRAADASGAAQTVVEVEDTGQGVPEADLQRIFIPFFTTKSQGHGVGLALAHRVATDHGGTLTARNTSRGAVFTMRLPA
jgi:PAS domain S-box-containing protein